MSINSQIELKEFIKERCECPVELTLADPAHNLGYHTSHLFSDFTIERLYREEVITHPLTRGDISDINSETMARMSDYLATAAIHLFISIGLIELSQLINPVPQEAAERIPLLQRDAGQLPPSGTRSSFFSSCCPSMQQHSVPVYYQSIANNIIDPEYGCQMLFLEPRVPQLPTQQRLLVCPFLASDGATYNLETLEFLLRNNLPSPITGQRFENAYMVFNRAMADILTECWNATGDCVQYFPHNRNLAVLSSRRAEVAAFYTPDRIKDLVTSLVQRQVTLPATISASSRCRNACGQWTRSEIIFCGITTTITIGTGLTSGLILNGYLSSTGVASAEQIGVTSVFSIGSVALLDTLLYLGTSFSPCSSIPERIFGHFSRYYNYLRHGPQGTSTYLIDGGHLNPSLFAPLLTAISKSLIVSETIMAQPLSQ